MDLIDNLFEIIGECAHLKRKIKSRISNSISTNSLTHSAGRCMRRASLRGYLFLHHSKAEEKRWLFKVKTDMCIRCTKDPG